jgi:hypothetical protein
MATDYAIHSDFLVHWTGRRDIDELFEPNWSTQTRNQLHEINRTAAIWRAYSERLRDILKFGIWLTECDEPPIRIDDVVVPVPRTPKTCFTKAIGLSPPCVKVWATRVGVKRPFVFQRLGRPLAYYGFSAKAHTDPLLTAAARDIKDKSLLNFFKPMNIDGPLDYGLYAESEWRILHNDQLLAERAIIDPRDAKNKQAHAYFQALNEDGQCKLRYLLPLDGWLSMIIYPSLATKNYAQQDSASGIRDEITRIKRSRDHGNDVEGGNWPVEVNLSACQHF